MEERIYLHIKDLRIRFKNADGIRDVLYIDEIKIRKGETYGIIGESGTGKTVLALSILGLLEIPPGQIASGQILLDGADLLQMNKKKLQRDIRGKKISMIFQDPMSTLNPVYTVGQQLVNVIMHTQGTNKTESEKKAEEWLRTVKLPDAERAMKKYPHELSGGQRQRVIIALALACGAEFLIADEPTRNLDVTIQAGVLKLLKELQRNFGVTCLFIANNPGLISAMCDQVAVLQRGEIIEKGPKKAVLHHSAHPYTKMLLAAIPAVERQMAAQGEGKERPEEGPEACKYLHACARWTPDCVKAPAMRDLGDGHFAKCHLCQEGDANG